MAQTFSVELAGIDSVPAVKPSATNGYGARLKRFRATITLASQASGDSIVLADLPAGCNTAFFLVNTSVSLGTATLTLSSPAGTYVAATTFTTANTPTMCGSAAAAALLPLTSTQ